MPKIKDPAKIPIIRISKSRIAKKSEVQRARETRRGFAAEKDNDGFQLPRSRQEEREVRLVWDSQPKTREEQDVINKIVKRRLRVNKFAHKRLKSCESDPPQYKKHDEPESNVGLKLPSQYQVDTDPRWKKVSDRPRIPLAPALEKDSGKALLTQLRSVRLKPPTLPVFGPEPENPWARSTGEPVLEEELDENNKPLSGDRIIGNKDQRTLKTAFVRYTFVKLDFLGLYNEQTFGAVDKCYVKHYGVHLDRGDEFEVYLPSSLVDELKSYVVNKFRDKEGTCFELVVSRCKELARRLDISSEQQYLAVLFAPAIAYRDSWSNQQLVSRVVEGAYLHTSLLQSAQLSSKTLKTVTRWEVGCIVFGLSLVALAVRGMVRVLRPNQHVVVPPAARLVGIELNPGPDRPVVRKWLCATKKLVNSANIKFTRRENASLRLDDGELRGNLERMDYNTRKGVVCIYGFDTKRYSPEAFCGNRWNELQALNARVLKQTIIPEDREMLNVQVGLRDCLSWCKQNFKHLFPRMTIVCSVRFNEYLLRSNASPSVKRILLRTHERLVADGITDDSNLSQSQLYQYTIRSSFVKVENNLYRSPLGVKEKAPRLIQGAQPEFICLVGPWVMALQDLLKRRWNQKHNLCFTSGISAEDCADFIMQGDGKLLEDDLGSFDCSISKPWCDFEVWMCKRLRAPRAVIQLMKANIFTHGKTHFGWRYKCEGTRKSGDPYTSIMNSIINGLSHLYLYCRWTGRSVLEARDSIRMLLQGDDNAMRHSESFEFPWREGMATLGFDSEAIYREKPEDLEFCSNRLYPVADGYVFGPKPGKVMAKLGYIINPPVNVTRESMMRGVALGLQQNCHFIPPLHAVVKRILELTENHQAFFVKEFEEHKVNVARQHISTVETMLLLDNHYYWDYGIQHQFEKSLQKMKLGDTYPQVCDLLLDRDTSGPQAIYVGA